MKRLTHENKEVIQSGLQKLEASHNKIIAQFYLDVDQDEMVAASNQALRKVSDLQSTFSGDSDLYILAEKDIMEIEKVLLRTDEIYGNDDSDTMKAHTYLALLDTIKAIIRKNE